jgi:hypothetical protein
MPVVINGVREFLKAVDELDDDMYKKTKANLKIPMLKVANKSKSYLPSNKDPEILSGWLKQAQPIEGQRRPFPAYDQSTAQKNIKYKLGPNKKNNKGYSVYNYVSNESAPGAIYETAGRKTRGSQGASLNPEAGIQFIQALPPIVDATLAGSVGRRGRKNKGRVIYRAWKEEQGNVYQEVQKAINDAIFAYYKKLPLERQSEVIQFYKGMRARGIKGL